MIKRFQTSIKKYDLICIGPYASQVGSQVHKILKNRLTSCFINNQVQHFQPSLTFTRTPYLTISKAIYPLKCDLAVGVSHIDAQKSNIHLHNGQVLKYKQLVYSGYQHQWKNTNYYHNLSQAINTKHSGVYYDGCKNINQIYGRYFGHIFISVPKIRHFGYENYYVLHLLHSLKNLANKNIKQTPKITMVLEGSQLLPFNKQHGRLIKQLIKQSNIQIVEDAQISSLDYHHKTININGCKSKFQCFYQYLPTITPSLLTSIDPFLIDNHTLNHTKYPNITIMGNNLPTTHSFYAMKYQNIVRAINISYSLLGVNKVAMYDGQSIIPFWKSNNRLMYLQMDYKNNAHLWNQAGTNSISSIFLALLHKTLARAQIQQYLNNKQWSQITSSTLQTKYLDRNDSTTTK